MGLPPKNLHNKRFETVLQIGICIYETWKFWYIFKVLGI